MLLLAVVLSLAPERAVSPPLLEPAGRVSEASLASNGDTMLAVWQDWRSSVSSEILAARISRAGAVLDPQGIAVTATEGLRESEPFVTWDGTHFLLAWRDENELHFATVDLEGRVTRRAAIDGTGSGGFARNGDRIAAVLRDRYVLDAGIVRPDLTFERTFRMTDIVTPPKIVGCGDGFLVLWPHFAAGRYVLAAQRLDRDAKASGPAFTLDTPLPHLPALAVATDTNGDALVAAAASNGLSVTRVRADGTTNTTRVRDTRHRADAVVVRTDGYDVVAAEEQRPRVYRFGAGDALIGVTEPLTGITWSGGGALSAGRTFTAWTMSTMLFGVFPFSTEQFVHVARQAPTQRLPVLARAGEHALLAWLEDIDGVRQRVMTGRVGLDGTPLAAPVMLANRYDGQNTPLAVACDATSCALAWTHDPAFDLRYHQTLLVSRLPNEPVVVSETASVRAAPAMTTSGTETLLAWVDGTPGQPRVKTYLLSTGHSEEIQLAASAPAIAFGRDSFLVVSTAAGTLHSARGLLRAAVVDREGRVQSVRDLTASPAEVPVAVAWSGHRYLIVYYRNLGFRGLYVDEDGNPDGPEFTIDPLTMERSEPPRLAWDGEAFIVVWRPYPYGSDPVIARIGGEPRAIGKDVSNAMLLGSLLVYQRTVPELTNVQRVFTRTIGLPRRRAVR